MAQTNERAFESYVMQMLTAKGWSQGAISEWDKDLALFPARVTAFIAETQPELWQQMRALHADQLETMAIKALVKELAVKGCLHVLRHGFKFYGKTFHTAYFKPAHGLNPEMLARYGRTELTVTRQVPCHPGDGSTVDLVFAVNGLPVATCELKSPRTGQNWRHAVRQYRRGRRCSNSKSGLWSISRTTPTRCTWPPAWRARAPFSGHSTGAAIGVKSSAGQATPNILQVIPPVICGRRCSSGRAFSISWATFCSWKNGMSKSMTATAANAWYRGRR